LVDIRTFLEKGAVAAGGVMGDASLTHPTDFWVGLPASPNGDAG
jgi:hypothetical protein